MKPEPPSPPEPGLLATLTPFVDLLRDWKGRPLAFQHAFAALIAAIERQDRPRALAAFDQIVAAVEGATREDLGRAPFRDLLEPLGRDLVAEDMPEARRRVDRYLEFHLLCPGETVFAAAQTAPEAGQRAGSPGL
jgi:hypothetical protein